MDSVIKFEPWLPCASTEGNNTCNKPANVAIVYLTISGLMLLPICADCSAEVSKRYMVTQLADELKPGKEQPTNGRTSEA